jgi:hypothetical protein
VSIHEYHSLANTRHLLQSLALTEGNYRAIAQQLLKHYPDTFRLNSMIGNDKEIQSGMWKRDSASNPIQYDPEKGGWIFWEETWTDWNGPFPTLEECKKALDEYGSKL